MSKEMRIGEKIVKFPGSIYKVLAYKNLVIVLFRGNDCVPHTFEVANRNVFAFDQHGDRVWIIESGGGQGWKCYLNIWISEDNQLMANGYGFDMIVNPVDGTLTPWRDPNWPADYKPRPW